MNKNVIHIQTYPPHFPYVINLLNGLNNYADDLENFDIVIVVDHQKDISWFNFYYNLSIKNLNIISLKEIMKKPFPYLSYNQTHEECSQSIVQKQNVFSGGYWGTANTPVRQWMNIKRTYGLLELERRGYEFVWCIDSESFPLNNFSINDIFSYSSEHNLLSVYEYGGWNDHRIVKDVLKINDDFLNDVLRVGVRINDFWIINLNYFKTMIEELTELHKNPPSFYVNGTEQGLYELWLYHKIISKKLNGTILSFTNEDFEGIMKMPDYGSGNTDVWCVLHWLFNDVYNNPDIDNKKFCERIQSYYFDKVHCYRGDLIKKGHAELFEHMKFKFAVSNWQGN